jgi:hypothetical protein
MDKSTIERMLKNGTLQTGEFPPTAPPPDVPLPPLPLEVLETKRLSRLCPPPRIIAAGTDDPVKLGWRQLPALGVPTFTLADYGPIPDNISLFVNDGKAVQDCTTIVKQEKNNNNEVSTQQEQASLAVV